MHNNDKATLKQYLTNKKNTTLDEGIQLSKIGHNEATTTQTLTKYKPHNNL